MARNCRFAVAVHIAAVLANNREHPATSDWIAGSVNTNPVVVRRILSALAKAGLVRSQRGSTGGSFLTREPKDISLFQLYRAVDEDEGPALHTHPPNPDCPVGANIQAVLVDIIERAETAKEREFTKITLADVVDSIKSRIAAA